MKGYITRVSGSLIKEKKWAFPLIIVSIIISFLLITSYNLGLVSSPQNFSSIFSIRPTQCVRNQSDPVFVESNASSVSPPPADPSIPRMAYLVAGSKGEVDRVWRTLLALYHPINQYIVHLDLESPVAERLELAKRIDKNPIFAKVGNVHMITKPNMVTYRGPTMVSYVLHACAVLLKKNKEWDWFIHLSASDYPLVTQDDLPKHLNFIEHTSDLGWKAEKWGKQVLIDPGIYKANKTDLFWVSPRRELPTAFKLFTGSAWMVLSRAFVEYCIWGWDNLPRALLMYYTNFETATEFYFQTIICNAPEFATTVVNHDLHYISWDVPPKQHPQTLNLGDMDKIIDSMAPFARKFRRDDAALDKIDADLLGRKNGNFTPGGWCTGDPLCSDVGDVTSLKPSSGAHRLQKLMDRIVRSGVLAEKQCI